MGLNLVSVDPVEIDQMLDDVLRSPNVAPVQVDEVPFFDDAGLHPKHVENEDVGLTDEVDRMHVECVDVNDLPRSFNVDPVQVNEDPFFDDDVLHVKEVENEDVEVIWVGEVMNCIPRCPCEKKPRVGMSFNEMEDAINFYMAYGQYCKFDVRLGGSRKVKQGVILLYRYLYCNKEGQSPALNYDALNEKSRKCTTVRTGCKAMIYVRLDSWGRYKIGNFVEEHNHLLATLEGQQFLSSQRHMTVVQKHLVVSCSKVNIGPAGAYKISKQLAGGFDKVGAQLNEFRNFQRDVIAYIDDYDAQIVINKLVKKQELYSSYYYKVKVVEGVLCNLFWSDPTSQLNYHAYGDVLSFDATYGLNRYNMIFIPFTGVDNHKKSVTFAAALVSKEDTETYAWVVKCFLKCMGKAPKVVITDQDAAVRHVIPILMPNTHHRFCIWHIMKKLPTKMPANSPGLKIFRSKLKSVVYDDFASPEQFDVNWNALLEEYDMAGNKWLNDLFSIRRLWIPAYFRDIPLGGLLRTTSRSESANSFFGRFLNRRLTLLGFFVGVDNALEFQRHSQAMCDHENRYKKSRMRTPLLMETHAQKVYTRMVFNDVQIEISAACFELILVSLKVDANSRTFQFQNGMHDNQIYEVSAVPHAGLFTCSCKMFDRVGYQCRHVFAALKNLDIHVIPSCYILNRWSPDALKCVTVDEALRNQCSVNVDNVDDTGRSDSDLWFKFQTCLYLAAEDKERRIYIESKLKEIQSHFEASCSVKSATSNTDVIRKLIGVDIPEEISVQKPAIVHTKGSGKRFLSAREEAIKKSKKNERTCKTCGKMGFHNSRTCPDKVIVREPINEVPIN